MRRSLLLVSLLLVVLASACGGASPSRTSSDAPPTAVPLGSACAPAVRDEFVRQQSLVHWQVYCPTQLPDGFRLARLDDPQDSTLLGGDVSPTGDDPNPGGGTFITRLVGPQGATLVLVQGAGADIYTLRDDAGALIADDRLSHAPFGDLPGKLYRGRPARITAFDAQSYGHMLIGPGVDAVVVAQLAAAMHPVEDVPTATPSASPTTPDAADRAAVVQSLPIAPFPSSFDYVPYDWSPDGKRVAFIGDGLALYIAEAPTYTPQLLAAGPASEPRWSPDGKLIAFDATAADASSGDGIEIASPEAIGSTRALRVSPADDEWRGRIVQVYRWLDDTTIAYDAHCGSGCQMLFEMTVERPGDGSPPRTAGVVRQVPFVRNCADCVTAALAFHYSPDGRDVVAETGTVPSLAWYERATDTQWLVEFADDPAGVDLRRELVSWDADGPRFAFRETIVPAGKQRGVWTFWRVDPTTRTRTQIAESDLSPTTGVPEVDRIVGETLAGDREALVRDIGSTTLGCVRAGQLGSPPQCLEGEPDGTNVDSFFLSACDGAFIRADAAASSVGSVSAARRLLAAGTPVSPGDDRVQFYVVFANGPSVASSGFMWEIRDGKIVGYVRSCNNIGELLTFVSSYMIPPR